MRITSYTVVPAIEVNARVDRERDAVAANAELHGAPAHVFGVGNVTFRKFMDDDTPAALLAAGLHMKHRPAE
jgi:hypothetical protein